MAVVQELKRIVEKLTGFGRPRARALARLVQPRMPQLFAFATTARPPTTACRWSSIAVRSSSTRRTTRPRCSRRSSPATAGARRGATASTTSCTSIRRPTRCWASPAARSIEFGGRRGRTLTPACRRRRRAAGRHRSSLRHGQRRSCWWSAPIPPAADYDEPKPGRDRLRRGAWPSIAKVKLPPGSGPRRRRAVDRDSGKAAPARRRQATGGRRASGAVGPASAAPGAPGGRAAGQRRSAGRRARRWTHDAGKVWPLLRMTGEVFIEDDASEPRRLDCLLHAVLRRADLAGGDRRGRPGIRPRCRAGRRSPASSATWTGQQTAEVLQGMIRSAWTR